MARIAVIGTGGSIATPARHELDLFEYGQFANPVTIDALLEAFAKVLYGFELVPVPFRAIDSVAADSSWWLALNREIGTAARERSIDGIVVTHGTSTLEETAYFLHLVVKVGIPVVLVAAQRPYNALSSDAGLNLVNALRVAAAPGARDLGVVVFMNDEIQCARDTVKVSNFRLNAFNTPDLGILGNVEPDGSVSIYRRPLRRHAPNTEFDVQELESLPSVDIVYCYAGASASAIDAFVHAGSRGIVVAGMPPGRASPAQRTALKKAARSGVLVVQSSRAHSGRMIQRSEDRDAGFVAADNLNPQKARVLAMLALTRTTDPGEIRRIFSEY
jgi:L-asparaginase